jgi:hypothetical protein
MGTNMLVGRSMSTLRREAERIIRKEEGKHPTSSWTGTDVWVASDENSP